MNDKEKAALGSIAASAGLTAAKTVVGLLTGSLAILSEAGHSLLDLSATVLTYFAVRISGKPADAEHQYGHGKVESVTALAETALLFLLTGVVTWEALQRLARLAAACGRSDRRRIRGHRRIDRHRFFSCAHAAARCRRNLQRGATSRRAAFFFRHVVVGRGVDRALRRRARLSFGRCRGRASSWPFLSVSPAGGSGAAPSTTLTDTAPAGISERVASIARQIPGIVGVERVRARPAGAVLFVDLGVGVNRTLPLDRVSAIKERLTRAIRAEIPRAEVTITTEPRALDDETLRERVMLIARNRGLAIHHVAVQTISGHLSVSADLEVEGTLALAAAHDIASGLEQAVREELGPDVEVETHIEPLPADVLAGRDASAARIAEVHTLLAAQAAEIAGLDEVHDVRVRETADGEIVNFHCRVDPTLSVRAVHDLVDAVERRLRRRFPTIQRVIGHAEPRR